MISEGGIGYILRYLKHRPAQHRTELFQPVLGFEGPDPIPMLRRHRREIAVQRVLPYTRCSSSRCYTPPVGEIT